MSEDLAAFIDKYAEPYDLHFLDEARIVAERSPCDTQIGAVVVNPTTVGTYQGWNAPPSAMEVRLKAAQRLGVGCRFFCERARKPVSDKDTGYNDCPTIHAEMMALVRAGDATVGATLYVNGAPCRQCAKLIAYCRIAQVVCSTSKAMSRQRFLDDTVRYLEAAGVKVWVLDEEA